jgi:hypothetical protein
MHITGSCHCGNIRYELDWPGEPGTIPVRACDCSFCTRHGGVWTSHPRATLAVTVRDESQHSRYRFGTGTADFHVCARCGTVPVVTSEIDGHAYAVVNTNTFENVERTRLAAAPASFGVEDTTTRLERRRRSWIAEVTVPADGATAES